MKRPRRTRDLAVFGAAVLLAAFALPVLCLAAGNLNGTITKNGAPMSTPYTPFVDVMDSQYGFHTQAVDINGYFALPGLPNGAASVDAYASETRYIGHRNANILPDQTVATDFDWSVGSVSGSVTRNGAPLTAAVIEVADCNNNWYQATTNSLGQYTVQDVTAGAVSVYCRDSQGQWLGYQTATVTREGVVTVNFSVLSTGTVTGEVRKNGALAEGARIDVLDYGGNWHTAQTNGSGAYSIPDVAAGNGTAYCYTPGAVFVESRAVTVPDGATATADFSWTTGAIQGTVTKAGATPPELVGAWIRTGRGEEATTNAGGFYSMESLSGPTTLSCYSPDGYLVGSASTTVPASGTVTVDFAWGIGAVRGTVTRAGGPLAGALVRVSTSDGQVYHDTTQSDGNYRVDDVASGPVTATAWTPEGGNMGQRTGTLAGSGELVLNFTESSAAADPDPFTPTGAPDSKTIITVSTITNQTGLSLNLLGMTNGWSWIYYGWIPLNEMPTDPGIYKAEWSAEGNSPYGENTIWVDDDYRIIVYDSLWQELPYLEGIVRVRGVSSLSESPSVLKPGTDTTVISAACAPALTDQLEVRIKREPTGVLLRTLPLSGLQGAPSVQWDGKDGTGDYVAGGNCNLEVWHTVTGKQYYPTATLHVLPGVTSVTATPNPFTPTGANAVTFDVIANPDQGYLYLRIAPLGTVLTASETAPSSGLYRASWNGLVGSGTLLASVGTYTLEVYDRYYINKDTLAGTLLVSGVQSVTAVPRTFEPVRGQTTTITISTNAATDLHLEARILDYSGTVRTLDNVVEGPPGIYTCLWDGRNEAGSLLPPGAYTIQVYNKDSNPKARYVPTGTAEIGIGVTSVEVIPDPFIPTGCNTATIRVYAYPNQLSLDAKVTHPLFPDPVPWQGYTRYVSLGETELGSGIYEGQWNPTMWSYGTAPVPLQTSVAEPSQIVPLDPGSYSKIIADSDSIAVVVPSSSTYEWPVTQTFRLHGVSSVSASPSEFCPTADETTTITALSSEPGLRLIAEILLPGSALTLPMSEGPDGTHTCDWDGKDANGDIVYPSEYTVHIHNADCPDGVHYYPSIQVSTAGIPAVTIGRSHRLPDGTAVRMLGKTVVASMPDVGEFYIEEPNRSAAIKVIDYSFLVPLPGTKVDVQGSLGLRWDGSERVLSGNVQAEYGPALPLLPVALSNVALGGSPPSVYIPSIPGAIGLYNVGLLVQIFGRITQIGFDYSGSYYYVYVDDGSNLRDGSYTDAEENVGVRIVCDPTGYNTGDYLTVTGVSSRFVTEFGQIAKRVLTRDSQDVVLLKAATGP
ncbi:MAG: FlgD immunoglobulin-like domain containing protein [Armatimonadota bacterium]|nr:FlgD immunoglobulin-like domain containing protein [Armatimonadota bacterium]